MKIIVVILLVVGLPFAFYWAGEFVWYSYFSNVGDWVYTWHNTYPELTELSCKILANGKITWLEKREFHKLVEKIQDERIKKENEQKKNQGLKELKKKCPSLENVL